MLVSHNAAAAPYIDAIKANALVSNHLPITMVGIESIELHIETNMPRYRFIELLDL